jgi:hypothetical protein
VAGLLETARQGVEALVGIHIRRGDYRKCRPQWIFEDRFYHALVNRLSSLFPERRCGFLVASDEDLAVRWPAETKITRSSGQIVEDLYALAGCDFLVGAPSTFCLWASFYGRTPYLTLTEERLDMRLDEFTAHEDCLLEVP